MIRRSLYIQLLAICFLSIDAESLFAQQNNGRVVLDSTIVTIHKLNSLEVQGFTELTNIDKGNNKNQEFLLYYNKGRKIKEMTVDLYNPDHKKPFKSYSLKDSKDVMAHDGFSIARDARFKIITYPVINPETIVRIHYKIEFENTLFLPRWDIFRFKDFTIDRSSYTLIRKLEIPINTRSSNVSYRKDYQDDKYQSETWYVTDVDKTRLKYDAYPSFKIAPVKAQYYGHMADLSSWESFGHFIANINKGRSDLTPDQIVEIKNEIGEYDDEDDLISKVYKYVQDRTRYVSIQLGIGGIQPQAASETHQSQYGDCKALSLYTQSILNAYNITSFYTLIESSNFPDTLYDDFVYDPFNHAILGVPKNDDVLWLECTADNYKAGYLSSTTQDREVLCIDDGNGVIKKTLTFNDSNSVIKRRAHFSFNESIKMDYVYEDVGLFSDRNHISYIKENWESHEIKSYLNRKINVPGGSLVNYELSYDLNRNTPYTSIQSTFDLKRIGKKAGKLLIVEPFFWDTETLETIDTSRFVKDIHYTLEHYQDTFIMDIPEFLSIKRNLKEKVIKNDYGSFKLKTNLENDKLVVSRHLLISENRYTKEEILAVNDLIKAFNKSMRTKISLTAKTEGP